MTGEEMADLARRLRGMANLLKLPAHPETWPEWMTRVKRRQMAARAYRDARWLEREGSKPDGRDAKRLGAKPESPVATATRPDTSLSLPIGG